MHHRRQPRKVGGTMHQQIQAAVFVNNPFDQLLVIGRLRAFQIQRIELDLPSLGQDLLIQRIEPPQMAATGNHLRTGTAAYLGHRTTEPTAGTGNHHHLACQEA